MRSFRSLIEALGTREAAARALEEPPVNVSAWWQRDSVPPGAWRRLVAELRQRGIDVSTDELAVLAEQRRVA